MHPCDLPLARFIEHVSSAACDSLAGECTRELPQVMRGERLGATRQAVQQAAYGGRTAGGAGGFPSGGGFSGGSGWGGSRGGGGTYFERSSGGYGGGATGSGGYRGGGRYHDRYASYR